jgi:hypothetical protein
MARDHKITLRMQGAENFEKKPEQKCPELDIYPAARLRIPTKDGPGPVSGAVPKAPAQNVCEAFPQPRISTDQIHRQQKAGAWFLVLARNGPVLFWQIFF